VADLLLGIDLGTSGARAGVFDPEGRLLGLGRSAYAMSNPRPGWAEADPEAWWAGILKAIAAACEQAQAGPQDVRAVGVDVLFPAVVALDRAGRPLAPALLYCDQRSIAQVRAIERAIGRERYEAIIGNALVPGTCAVTSMAWLRDERPEAYSRAAVLGFANTFVVARLTGEFAADPSTVGLSGLADARDPSRWSEKLCEKIGIDPSRLPRVAGCAEVVGTVCAAAADETGLSRGTPVVCGGGDVPVCAFGAGVLEPGSVAYIAGSTDCVAAPMSRPSPDRRWATTAHVRPGRWLGIGTTTSSGVSVEWFAREVLGSGGPQGLRQMTELASASPAGSRGLLFLPYLQGERTPVWDPLARGVFVGLTAATTRADMARAVFEGTAFALRHVFDCLPDVVGSPVQQVRAVGGGTRNALWNQIKADVLGRSFDVLEFQETGAFGAALLAGVGVGIIHDLAQAAEIAREAGGAATVAPNHGVVPLYGELFSVYDRLYGATRELIHTLATGAFTGEAGAPP